MVNFKYIRSDKKFKLSTYDLEYKLVELLKTLKKAQWPTYLRDLVGKFYIDYFFSHPLTLH